MTVASGAGLPLKHVHPNRRNNASFGTGPTHSVHGRPFSSARPMKERHSWVSEASDPLQLELQTGQPESLEAEMGIVGTVNEAFKFDSAPTVWNLTFEGSILTN